MPNAPKTPHLSVRVPPALRAACKARAAREGETLTAVVLRALEAYASADSEVAAAPPA